MVWLMNVGCEDLVVQGGEVLLRATGPERRIGEERGRRQDSESEGEPERSATVHADPVAAIGESRHGPSGRGDWPRTPGPGHSQRNEREMAVRQERFIRFAAGGPFRRLAHILESPSVQVGARWATAK